MPTAHLITLLTDFGTSDTYVGQMKGVIAGIAPDARVIDLTHQVPPQNITAAAAMLDDAIDAFPAGTIHVAVVDPGVGSARRAVAVETDCFTFVGPDNGIFAAALQRYPLRQAMALSNAQYQRAPVSATFHGRDVFCAAAAHLAKGVPITALGEPIAHLVEMDLPRPVVEGNGLRGAVLWVDHFGNLITNIRRPDMLRWGRDPAHLKVWVQAAAVGRIADTFSDVAVGEAVAYFGSTGRLEIARRNGSAAQRFGVGPGGEVLVR